MYLRIHYFVLSLAYLIIAHKLEFWLEFSLFIKWRNLFTPLQGSYGLANILRGHSKNPWQIVMMPFYSIQTTTLLSSPKREDEDILINKNPLTLHPRISQFSIQCFFSDSDTLFSSKHKRWWMNSTRFIVYYLNTIILPYFCIFKPRRRRKRRLIFVMSTNLVSTDWFIGLQMPMQISLGMMHKRLEKSCLYH